jgi:hypothetical protein
MIAVERRVRMRHCGGIVLLVTVIGVVGCSGDSPFGRESTRLTSSMKRPSVAPAAVQVPLVSCVPSIVDSVRLVETASVAIRGRRKPAGVLDKNWSPASVSAFVADENRTLVSDRRRGVLHLFDAGFTREFILAPELRDSSGQPATVRAIDLTPDEGGGGFWMLDGISRRAVHIRPDGVVLESIQLRTNADGIAALPGNRLAVVNRTILRRIRTDTASDIGTLVDIYDVGLGRVESTLVRYTPETVDTARLNLPGPTHILVRSRGAWLAVGYPAAGIVDVYRNLEFSHTATLCMPPEVRIAYSEQAGLWKEDIATQTWVPLFSDLLLGNDGSLAVIGPIKDQHGEYHRDHFDATGRSTGSIRIVRGPRHLPREVRFAGRADMLLGVLSDGSLVRFSLEPIR